MKLSKEMQMLYDWCECQKNNLDKASKCDDFNDSMMFSVKSTTFCSMIFSVQSTTFWNVQQFIKVNFNEGE